MATAPAEEADTVKNDSWFPDIALKPLREAMRLDGTVTQARLKEAVISAIAQANTELLSWQCLQRQAGYLHLSALPAAKVNEESIKMIFYRRAIYHFVKADLIEQYSNFDSTHTGKPQLAPLEAVIEHDRRNARWALSDVQDGPHVTVELI